ncbi:hypothetical protein PRIC2_005685 [Phytophthora ramorum]
MAFWAGREGWRQEDDGWRHGSDSEDEHEQEDALFGSLDCEEEADSIQDDPFAMERVETDMMQLGMVERLSWDATSEASSEEENEALGLLLPTLLPIQVGMDHSGEDENLQWSLISPCSDAASPRVATLSPLTRVSISSPVRQLRFFEPEHEPSDEQVEKKETEQPVIEEEETTAFDPETAWFPDMNSVLSSPAAKPPANPFVAYDDALSDSDDEDEQNSNSSALRPSLLPRVSTMTPWRREKARTCSGASSAGMPTALSLDTFKARTRSLSRSRNQSIDDEDDGDFSSDDEGYTPELHGRRASETEPLGASQWRRARHTSMNFSGHRLSMTPSVMMTKRLREARTKLNSGLHLLRSGSSASTVNSEESFLDSPAFENIKSAPAGLHREPSIFSDAATSTSLISASSSCNIGAEQHHPTRQQQLRAGVFKAAGFINAASAEAARKLKSRGFRAPQLPRQKAPSETEEEDPEHSTPPPPASPFTVKATSAAP